MNNSRSHTVLVSAIVARLNAIPEVRAMKLPGGRYMRRGTPDVVAVACGRAAFLEAKTGAAELTMSQRAEAALWRLSGARVAVVRSVDEAEAIVRELLGQVAA